ncbi:MAG: inositol monophosphatase family protein [Pseudonocardia sp.]
MAIRYFCRTGLEVRHKPDGSPVTEADRHVERLLRMRLALARPDDAVVGEEFDTTGTGARRWFIDPVDGTAGFIAGRPGWRTLLAVEIDEVVTTGVVSAPALGRAGTRAAGAVRGSVSTVSETRNRGFRHCTSLQRPSSTT